MTLARPQFLPFPRQPQKCFSGYFWRKVEYGYIPIATEYMEPQYLNKHEYRKARFAYLAHIGRPLYKQILKNYMPVTRKRRQWATYMQLAINGAGDDFFDKTFYRFWAGTLPQITFTLREWDMVTGGVEINWTRPEGFLTTSDYRVMAFALNWDSRAVWCAQSPTSIIDESLVIPMPDFTGQPGIVYAAFTIQIGARGIVAISPCNIISGTGWYWRKDRP